MPPTAWRPTSMPVCSRTCRTCGRKPAIAENLASTKGALTIDGKQWGVPYTYYQWGVYYRKDIYEELGLRSRRTGTKMKANCQKILDSGRKCFTIGTKFLWTAGGWFDYLNMRTNGFDFHMALARGEVKWTDDRVRETFANWRELIDMGGFIDNHQTYSWQEALPFMVNGRGGRIPDRQLRGRAAARSRPDRRSARLLPVPGDQRRASRWPKTRRPTRSTSRRTQEQGRRARVPALRGVGRGPDRDQQRQEPRPAAGQREVVGG